MELTRNNSLIIIKYINTQNEDANKNSDNIINRYYVQIPIFCLGVRVWVIEKLVKFGKENHITGY